MTIASLQEDILPVHKVVGQTDDSVIQGEITLNSCDGIHIGSKYENSNNIIINQNVTVQNEKQISHNVQLALKEGLVLKKELRSSSDPIPHQGSIKRCRKLLNPISIASFSLSLLLTTVLVMRLRMEDDTNIIITTPIPLLTKTPVPDSPEYPISLGFVQRESWGAAPPRGPQKNNTVPVPRVTLIHTVSSGTCNRYATCVQIVLGIQDQHTECCGDIGYNFVIGSDGYIYVGVGWDKVGAHSCDANRCYNTGYLGVAFIGDFRTDQPNALMISSLKTLLNFGIEIKKLSNDYQLFGHCQITTSFPVSPGKNIMSIVKQWDHWNNTNIDQCKG